MINYSDVVETPMTDAPICARLSIQVVTLLRFLVDFADNPEFWGDYDEYKDEIDALLSEAAIAVEDASDECAEV